MKQLIVQATGNVLKKSRCSLLTDLILETILPAGETADSAVPSADKPGGCVDVLGE